MEKANSVWNLVNDLATKKGITEIVINDPKRVFVERDGAFIQLNVNLTKKDMNDFIAELADYNKKTCDDSSPIFDGIMPDGSRINAIIEPFAHCSPAISIRKYIQNLKNFDQNPDLFGLGNKWVDFFKSLVSAKMNVIVSGGTGVGKTTFLNLLLAELSPAERVITIEDTLELNLDIPNLVRLESRMASVDKAMNINTRDLIKNTLRMRPDRIIIGEIRGGELFDLLQAMNTGHEGSMSTIHANTPGECFSRMETLYLLSGYEMPYRVVRKQISTALDFVVQLSRNKEGKRVVSQIQEITGMEGDVISSQTIGSLEDEEFKGTGLSPEKMEQLHHMGGLPRDFFSTIA